jgi:hypothetical protein
MMSFSRMITILQSHRGREFHDGVPLLHSAVLPARFSDAVPSLIYKKTVSMDTSWLGAGYAVKYTRYIFRRGIDLREERNMA